MRVVRTYSLYRLKILSYMDGRHVFAQYGPIERRPIVTSRFTEGRKRTQQKEAKGFEQKLAKEAKVIFEKLPFAVVNPPRFTNLTIIWENRRVVLANTRKRSLSTEVIRGNKRHSFEG